MKTMWKKRNSGVTLIEIVVTMVILFIVVLGAMGYRYWCALNARKADVQATGARVGSMLLESWKAAGGLEPSDPLNYYHPENLVLGFDVVISNSGATGPGGFTDTFGNYLVITNRVNYYATLSYQDVAGEPRLLSVNVAWMPWYQAWDTSEPYRAVRLTTYAN